MPRGPVCGGCPRNPRGNSYDSGHPLGACPAIKHHDEVMNGTVGDEGYNILDHLSGAVPHVLLPTAHIGLTALERAVADRDVVVIDERAVDWIWETHTFPVSELEVLLSDKFSDVQVKVNEKERFSFKDIMWDLINNATCHWTLTTMQDAAGLVDDVIMDGALDKAIRAYGGKHIGFADDEYNGDDTKECATRLLNLLRKGSCTKARLYRDGQSGKEHLLIKSVRDVSSLDGVPVLILDASADKVDHDVYEVIFNREFEFVQITGVNEDTIIKQDPEKGWARQRCRGYASDDESKVIDEMIEFVGGLSGIVGVVSWKDNPVVAELVNAGVVDRSKCLHYGALRGRDNLSDVHHLVMIGGPSPNAVAFHLESMRYDLDHHGDRAIPHFERGYMTDHYKITYPLVHGHTIQSKYVMKKVIYDELYQAIGRSRGLDRPVEIHAFVPHDCKIPEFDYEVVAGRCRTKGDYRRMWDMVALTFKSKKEIAKASRVPYETVKKMLRNVDLDKIRMSQAYFMHDYLNMSWGDVAREMGISRMTLSRKRQQHNES